MEQKLSDINEYAKIVLKDCLEGIHKVVTIRVTVISFFITLSSGSLYLAAVQRAVLFLAAAALFTILLVLAEIPQRRALWSHYYRYIDVSNRHFGVKDDFTWMAGFTSRRLLEDMSKLALDATKSEAEKRVHLSSSLNPVRNPTYLTLIGFGVLLLEVAMLIYCSISLNWGFFPQAAKTVVNP